MPKSLIPLAAILCITVIEAIALAQGIDGTMLALSIGVISGLGGYSVRSIIKIKKSV
jgi:hypothetical protein